MEEELVEAVEVMVVAEVAQVVGLILMGNVLLGTAPLKAPAPV